LIPKLQKIYGQSFAAGYSRNRDAQDVLRDLNETSLSQLRRDHQTGHLEHKVGLWLDLLDAVQPSGSAIVCMRRAVHIVRTMNNGGSVIG
jgi:hypothetical protein